jgi:hypothetical protein
MSDGCVVLSQVIWYALESWHTAAWDSKEVMGVWAGSHFYLAYYAGSPGHALGEGRSSVHARRVRPRNAFEDGVRATRSQRKSNLVASDEPSAADCS